MKIIFNDNLYYLSFYFEPIIDPALRPGKMFAIEMLSRVRKSDYSAIPAEIFFRNASYEIKCQIFDCQINYLKKWQKFLVCHSVIVSVNIDFDIARHIASSPLIQGNIRSLFNCIALEVNEHFLSNAVRHEPISKAENILFLLFSCSALWLDDFGTGTSNFDMVDSGLFSVVKIAKDSYVSFSRFNCANLVLKPVCDYILHSCSQIIIEGIESENDLSIIDSLGVKAQGYLWPGSFDIVSLVETYNSSPIK